jgi:hypothetical protein
MPTEDGQNTQYVRQTRDGFNGLKHVHCGCHQWAKIEDVVILSCDVGWAPSLFQRAVVLDSEGGLEPAWEEGRAEATASDALRTIELLGQVVRGGRGPSEDDPHLAVGHGDACRRGHVHAAGRDPRTSSEGLVCILCCTYNSRAFLACDTDTDKSHTESNGPGTPEGG